MIKVPATVEGIRAVEALTADGINVNITLMFSLEHYEAVAQAYLQGIDRHGSAQGRVGRLGIRQPPRSGRGSAARGDPVRLRRWLSGERLLSRTPNASTVASARFSTARPSRL